MGAPETLAAGILYINMMIAAAAIMIEMIAWSRSSGGVSTKPKAGEMMKEYATSIRIAMTMIHTDAAAPFGSLMSASGTAGFTSPLAKRSW